MPDPGTVRAFLEERHVQLAARVTEWVRTEIAPLPEPADDGEARAQARFVLHLLGSAGWLRPIEERDARACGLIRESLAEASPLADAVFALQALGTTPLLLAGAAGPAKRWIDAALAGEAMAAFAMTEPEAGSDVAAMTTSARLDGDSYVLDGTKTLISNAGLADFYVVFAQSEPAKGKKGIVAVVVPADSPGLRFVKAQILSAPHPLGEIAFSDCRVPAANRLGGEGAGLRIGLATLDRLRATVAASACGMAGRALDEACAWAKARRQFGKLLAEHQLVQAKIARMATDLAAARLLTYHALREKDLGAERTGMESGMAKAFATEAAQRIVDDAVQILGGRGVLAEHPVERLYRAVRALRIYEGTTEIQQLIIAGHLLADAS
ncbi:MAG: acyl-CoA dehydrogenase family protein [Candidatus Eiseniibacteriota bacterium]